MNDDAITNSTESSEVRPERTFIAPEYYQQAFALFHERLREDGYRFDAIHPIRQRFWQFAPKRNYDQVEARGLLHSYLRALESEISKTIKSASLGYWLHLYRRLFPGPIGRDKKPATVGLTRCVFEAAFQKYGHSTECEKVGIHGQDAGINQVLGGLLLSQGFEIERDLLQKGGKQLMLTRFTHVDLMQVYDVEKLAYEIWRTGAMLRLVGKGAPLLVDDTEECVYDGRSDELDTLVQHYDSRGRKLDASATGAVFNSPFENHKSGVVLLPVYNLGKITSSELRSFFGRAFRIIFPSELIFNFIWVPLNLKDFREVHQALAPAFSKKHGVTMDAVLAIIAALAVRVIWCWNNTEGRSLVRFWQRAYEGPYARDEFYSELAEFIPAAVSRLGLTPNSISSEEYRRALKFWELDSPNQKTIDLVYSGPHCVFLPFPGNRVFIDYAWIHRRLYDLFVGVPVENGNFKGEALEIAVGRERSILPTKRCRLPNGEQRQIDSAYAVGSHLIIVECKAVGRSIAFDRGDPEAISYRQVNVLERALSEADEKAHWLARHPVGSNYDISRFTDILPVGVSPFVEFIPSKEPRYWISDQIPRMLTPHELADLLDDHTTINESLNRITVDHAVS